MNSLVSVDSPLVKVAVNLTVADLEPKVIVALPSVPITTCSESEAQEIATSLYAAPFNAKSKVESAANLVLAIDKDSFSYATCSASLNSGNDKYSNASTLTGCK